MEPLVLEMLQERWPSDTPLVVLEIGAFPGTLMRDIVEVFPMATCYAVEACPQNAKEMADALADLPSVHVLQRLIAGECAERKFFIANRPGKRPGSSISNSMFRKHVSTIKWARGRISEVIMDSITLDALFEELGIKQLHLLYMNCEGCEYEVLSGPTEFFKFTDMMAFQMHGRGNTFKDPKFKKVRNGLRLRLLDQGFVKKWSKVRSGHKNFIFMKKQEARS